MSRAPEDGVLAPDLTVHGIENLSVVSSSAFCSSSQANPTFLLVVLALRRADALRARLARKPLARHGAPIRQHVDSAVPGRRREGRPASLARASLPTADAGPSSGRRAEHGDDLAVRERGLGRHGAPAERERRADRAGVRDDERRRGSLRDDLQRARVRSRCSRSDSPPGKTKSGSPRTKAA